MADPEKANTSPSKAPSGPKSLITTMESGTLNDKISPLGGANVLGHQGDKEEDEDMDALIDELESNDGLQEDEEGQGEETLPGTVRAIPEEFLQTDTRRGLAEAEVLSRRKKFGLNQMKEEKENLVLKFLGYFIGPIQFVMEVRLLYMLSFLRPELCGVSTSFFHPRITQANGSLSTGCSCSSCRSRRLG
jgi:H+-transporting ATPase